jgi:crotonobetainyl-CoA:carnitine CoA-transferase CaiB-like acyl-CoA transferase
MLSPHRKPFATTDGHICVLPYNDKHWRRFFELIDKSELVSDPRFASQAARSENIDALYAIVAEAIQTRSSAAWLETLEAADIPCGPLYQPDDLFDDPHLQAVGMFPEVEHPSEGTLHNIKPPVSFSKTPGGLYRHAESLGASTAEVLAEVGYDAAAIERLAAAGVIQGRAGDQNPGE